MVKSVKMTHVDVKTSFSNGLLNEDIWFAWPGGISSRPSKTPKLINAIHGLKKAHLMWHNRLCNDLKPLGLIELSSASCMCG